MEFKKGVVVFLDALGTKGVWARTSATNHVKSWKSCIAYLNLAAKSTQTRTGNQISDYRIISFSDTIIITMNGEDPDILVRLIGDILAPSLLESIYQGVFLRGAISIGQYYQSKESFLLGPAVDEAAEWHEQGDWIGVIASPSMAFAIDRLREKGEDLCDYYSNYKIPLNNNHSIQSWALNWPVLASATKNPSGETTKSLILKKFAEVPTGVQPMSKYQNTLQFFDYVLEQMKARKAQTA